MEYDASEIVLKGGSRGLIVNIPSSKVMSLQFHFRAGSRFVDDYKNKWETAHIMEHMAFGANNGYASAHEFDMEFTRNGAYHNAWTSDTAMCYVAECADFEWDRILELQRSTICDPLFLRSEFRGEFGNVKSELTGFLSSPNRVLWPKISQEIGEDTFTYKERLELMDKIHLSDIKNHYEKTHTKGNMRFVLTGNFEGRLTRVKEILDGFSLKDGDRLPIPVDELHSFEPFAIRRKDVPNITFGWTMNLPRRVSDSEAQAMSMLNHILNGTLHSRIQGEARKRGLVYGIWSETSAYEHNSSWDFGAEVGEEKIDELFSIIVDEVSKIKDGDISDKELDDAKQYALGRIQIGIQTTGQLNQWLGDTYFFDGRIEYLDEQPDKIKAVTRKGITELVNEFISTECWGIGIYGNTNKSLAEKLHEGLEVIYQ